MKIATMIFTATVIALMYAVFFLPIMGQASAYQPPVLQVIQDMQNQHPDVWNACDAVCVNAALKDNGWWITPLAVQKGVDPATVAKYAVTWSYDWGIRFEQTKAANTDCRAKSTPTDNKCAPTMYDWVNAYADNIAQIGYNIQASPQIFAVNTWSDNRFYRAKLEYGGPF